MKYCLYYDYESALSQLSQNYSIIKSIHNLVCKDDNSGSEAYLDDENTLFNDDWLAFDLDELEREVSKTRIDKNPLSSMDMGFIICENGRKELVLVEFRFNFTKFSNIIKKELDDKVCCSTKCVNNHLEEIVYPKQFFIFAKNKIQEGRNRLRRMNPTCSPHYIACGIQDLYQKFFL